MEDERTELTPEAASAAAPTEPTPPVAPEKQSEPAPIDPRVEALIRETEQRLSGKLGSLVDRVSRSTKDETQAKFDELRAQSAEQYQLLAQQLDKLVASGKLSAEDAAVQKISARDELEQRALTQSRQAQTQTQPAYRQPDPDLIAFNAYKRGTLKSLNLTGEEPEYGAIMARMGNPATREDAEDKFERLAKEVRKAVDARVNKSNAAAPPEPKAAPILEAGGGGAALKSGNAEEELARLNKRINDEGLPDDPKEARKLQRRMDELSKQLYGG